MFRHNLLIIYRNFKRYRGSFFINLFGLSTGLACAVLIYLWVNDELSVDKFHVNDSRLYQVVEQSPESVSGNPYTSGPLADALMADVPEVELAVASSGNEKEIKTLSIGDFHLKANVKYASEAFFKVFSYDLVQGNENQVLSAKNSVVISQSLALKLFRTTEDVIGKIVEFEHDKNYQVSGVFKDIPSNSSMQFDFVLSFEEYKEIKPSASDWNYNSTTVYVLLKEGSNLSGFNKKISNYLKGKRSEINQEFLAAYPYTEAYLYGNGGGGRIKYVRLFSIIALFILLISCVNFMNLSTAMASRKLKEVGIKKVVGVSRNTLIGQYLGESILLSFISLFIAIITVFLFLPQFNHVTDKHLSLNFDISLVISVLLITVFTGLVAGSYPALYLSAFKPVTILKGKLNNSAGELLVRKGLVVFQFTVSVIFIVAVAVVYHQIEYVQSKNLGYNKENIIHFEIEGKVNEGRETFLLELKKIPGILDASSIGQNIVGNDHNMLTIDEWEGKKPDYDKSFEMRAVNYDLIELLDIKLAEGRSFSRNSSTEDSKIIFNEAAVKEMGLDNPVGKFITIQGTKLQIIGIIKDFNFTSLHTKVSPMFLVCQPSWTHTVMVKIAGERQQETISKLQQFYKSYNPGFSFDYKFLDDDYQAQYVSEQRVSVLSKYFSGIAVIISCLGLFGLAAFTAERRRKEVGVRKIIGASTIQIVQLLSGEFTKIILTAIIIALPLSYLVVQHWLEGFAYRIELQWWYFIGAGLTALLIAWMTVGMHAIKAALGNPVKNLRAE